MSQVKMDRYMQKRKLSSIVVSDSGENSSDNASSSTPDEVARSNFPKEIDLDDLPWDPADRKRLSEYHPNQRDDVRRKYLTRGPYQPRGVDFPQRMIGKKLRRFNPVWFYQYSTWLEYSVKEDKVFCLCCYLFRDLTEKQSGHDAFIIKGFSSWNKIERLATHVGDFNSSHNKALKKCEDLMRQGQSIDVAFQKQGDVVPRNECPVPLNAVPISSSTPGDVSEFSGGIWDLLQYAYDQNEELLMYAFAQNWVVCKVVLQNARRNNQMASPVVQKDIIHCFAQEIVKSIVDDIGNDVLGVVLDESSDASGKKHLVVILRYVDKCGIVKERFIGTVHVMERSSSYLKFALDSLFVRYGLSWKKIRVQGYNSTSNLRKEFNGLKALIMGENNSAYYVHWFAHKLHLVVVEIAREHNPAGHFFCMIDTLKNVIGTPSEWKDKILERHKEKVKEAINVGEIDNQKLSLQRVGDTQWGSHYKSLLHLFELFSTIVEVLEFIENEGKDDSKRSQAYSLLTYFQSFDFVFYLHLLLHILGLTDSLSLALQRRDQDILNAISLVSSTKRQLQRFRDDGWGSLWKKISSFCDKYNLSVLNMDEFFVNPKKPRECTKVTNLRHYMVDCFHAILDLQLQELNDRFNDLNSELLTCMASFNPSNSFKEFNPSKLMRLSEFYPNDFGLAERMALEFDLSLFVDDVQEDERFANLNGLSDLARVMVDTRKHLSYPLIYRLLKLALTLPVATPTVERCSSAMKTVKNVLCNQISDQFLNDCLICYVENDVFELVSDEVVMDRFQMMKTQSEQL